ncbi:transcription elongation factor B polypeptide 3 [Ochlerotatus camptorhynchus]|uniref:transcription elongation factor B polypeptide 3 n=1 Tax=Ochlerotatus camptorhynchus TaxID=644619 RepID=UPI0031DF9C99
MSSIVDIINHYQKSIDRSLNDEARLVHCIGKLYRLPVSVQHLQETGIGRTVNGLRKYDGEVGVAAKALVSKWKNMVAAEESDTGEPEPQHQDHEEEDEDNYDESCLQVDEDRHSDDHHEEEVQDEEDEDEEEQHQQDEESDNQEEMQTPHQQQQVTNGHDSDHRSARSSHRDSDRHRSSSKHKSDRHSHHSSSSSKDGSRSRDRHEKHRDGEKNQHHSSSSSSSSSSKGHSSSPSSSSSKKSSRHENEGKEKKDKHSSRKDSSHANGKESSHSSSKEKASSSDKHHSKSKESLNGFTKEDESQKRKRRTSEDEEESVMKKVKDDQSSESKSKSRSKSSSSGSNSSKDRSSSKSSSSGGSSKEKDKNRSSEKKTESSSKRKTDPPPDNFDDEDDDTSGGASFADALAMIGMPSTSKKKGSSKGSTDKVKTSSSSMPPPPVKSSRSSSSKRSASPSSTASSSGYSSCSSTPSLLVQKPKLGPLQIAEIVESLPMISPNYKPMPLNQTVMECVFSNNGKPQKRPMSEEEALGLSMQSKNLRTKVYSGVKSYNGEVPTLYNLCIRLLQEHIDLIDYTGGIPFDLLKPVLERASPDQLFTLENYNSYLMEDSDVLWEQHCKRLFRSQKRKEEECESWREMFIRCSEERETKLLSLTANIKQSQVAKAAPIRKTQLAYVDSAVKPPRSVISKQARYGTAQAPVVSPAARVAALKNATSNVAKAGDSRLKVAAGIRDTAQTQVFHPMKPKKAPLMSKVMQSIKGFKGFRR